MPLLPRLKYFTINEKYCNINFNLDALPKTLFQNNALQK